MPDLAPQPSRPDPSPADLAAWGLVPAGAPGAPGATPEAQAETIARLKAALTAMGRYQIVERLEPRPHYHPPDGTATRRALYVDVETTGLEPDDRIIQLAIVPFDYCPRSGRVYGVEACESWLEDPGRPIPEEVVALTGITDAQVRGRRIDEARVGALLAGAGLVIAHNARFDRPQLERRLPAFADVAWACSCDDIPWKAEGIQSAKLEWLAYKLCGMYYEAHRADADCLMGVHLLATPLRSGEPAMAAMLRTARCATLRVWAVRSPIESKDRLKRRGYRWNGDEAPGRPRAWWRDVPREAVDAEGAWLAEHVYAGEPRCTLQCIDARARYSDRVAAVPHLSWGEWVARRRSAPPPA